MYRINRDRRKNDVKSNSNTFLQAAYSDSKRSNKCALDGFLEHEIDYKNRDLLSKFTSEYGRILPRRITSVSAKKQRMLALAIKRARFLALLPYCDK
ncbi:MAG: hypothetical protein sL5_07290 [Candidatus Mesenet longicola]|uniref:Small ribosomal subunit protein bS18 n=1 Tax=Candidatus Mesenet longicola TaxID=1892558 RepID=A0A8J3HQ09_9RICK|nr:MAG: hypothetical protein sGL2_07850 [Candidatus Mesenet longicola]GHM59736.1 MAG: hypothetical protein sL5_07290 [Candidatus Mesenet longicola]